MFVVAMAMLLIVFLSALVMAHVALPEMRRGNTLFVRDEAEAGAGAGRTRRFRVPLGWSEPQPGPRHAR